MDLRGDLATKLPQQRTTAVGSSFFGLGGERLQIWPVEAAHEAEEELGLRGVAAEVGYVG